MKSFLVICLLATSILNLDATGWTNGVPSSANTGEDVPKTVKIYRDSAEIIQPLDPLPLEFSSKEWSSIVSNSFSLIGKNITLIRQTITEKKESLNHQQIYIRSPSSSQTETKFVAATMVDEKRNLVQLIDDSISKEPLFFHVPPEHILYIDEPPESKYYVEFLYNSTETPYITYRRSDLHWDVIHQLDLFEGSRSPEMRVMANIRNNGKSKIEIEHAELANQHLSNYEFAYSVVSDELTPSRYAGLLKDSGSPIKIEDGQEFAGIYFFKINQAFSINGKTNYILPMFYPKVDIARFYLIRLQSFIVGKSRGLAARGYRLSADHFLPSGKCSIREDNYHVDEIDLPDLAMKNQHEFVIKSDPDVVYNNIVTLISSRHYNETDETNGELVKRTESLYIVHVTIKNFKSNRSVAIEYEQIIEGKSVELVTSKIDVKQFGTTMEHTFVLKPGEEKILKYSIRTIV